MDDLRRGPTHSNAEALRKSLRIAFKLPCEKPVFLANHLSESYPVFGWHQVGGRLNALRPPLNQLICGILRFLRRAVRVSFDVILLEEQLGPEGVFDHFADSDAIHMHFGCMWTVSHGTRRA
jgi:hypothetical protein